MVELVREASKPSIIHGNYDCEFNKPFLCIPSSDNDVLRSMKSNAKMCLVYILDVCKT
jgi:hypothetical protein